jgi:aspartate/methionine/tyrosine aminotransferase
VFATYTRLAIEHEAINLGQGFPDFDTPGFVLDALRASAGGHQQYSPPPGLPELLEAISEDHARRFGRTLDPVTNIQITVGATEGLFAAVQALVDPGDEVVIFEPFYDAYPADVTMAGGIPKFVPLHPQSDGRWHLDEAELRACFNPKTKLVILNTPHNPSGKLFSPEELDLIVELAERYDSLILSDEVYEHIAFGQHLPLASRPGAWARTLTISSIGKTFSVTGWKVGWASGPAPLIQAIRMAHQWIPFTVATPLQRASATILNEAARQGNTYYQELKQIYLRKRDLLVTALRGTPFSPLVPEGGYFVIADSRELGYRDDVELCNELPSRAGVAAIPPSAFYSAEHKMLAKHLVRFAYCKRDDVIKEAGDRLKKLAI